MCGISGIISKKNLLDKKHIIRMNGMISHRGPDQSGYLEHKNVLLGHIRLSVIDISDNGRQPMSNDGRFWIIFNGEVYNYLEIKDQLLQKNYKFYSKTDTEVILNAFKEWGVKCFDKFNGDWVIVILDKENNEIIIARDPIGCKPCYIYEDEHKIAFSSEIKGFMGINKNLNFDEKNIGINETTLYAFSKTIFKHVSQLPPGRFLTINLDTCKKTFSKWWFPLENLPKIHPNYEVNQGEYYELLYEATKLRLNADLKIGTSLSGGLDSSVIFTMLNLIQKNEKILDDRQIDLNPTIMDYFDCKTSQEAIKIANHYDRNYTIINSPDYNIEEISKLCSKLEIVEEYFRQPLLYEKQKKLGIHISIDGHGADEFLGTPSYLPYLALQNYNQMVNLNLVTSNFKKDKIKNRIKELLGDFTKSNKLMKFNFKGMLNCKNLFQQYTQSNNFSPDLILIEDDLHILDNFDLATQYFYFKTHCGWMQWYLGKWDRASMSSAVEVRSPFLDKNIILYSLALPIDKKIQNGKFKSILRDSMEALLPTYITNQNFKQGLPRIQIDFSNNSNLKYIENTLQEKDFVENSLWDSKQIKKDFNYNIKNDFDLSTIWRLIKYYLMLKGFKDRYHDVVNNYDHNFYTENNLNK